MKTILTLLVALTLFVSPALAQEKPKDFAAAASTNKADGIELPPDQTVGNDEGFVSLTAICKGQVKWLVVSGTTKVKYIANTSNNSVIVSIPPSGGVVSVFAVGLVEGKLTDFVRTNLTISVPSPTPPGPNPPGPNPPPAPPGPVQGPMHITFVADLNNVSPQLALILNSQTLQKAITDKGNYFRVYDINAPQVTQKKLDQVLKQVGGNNALIIQRSDGVLLDKRAIPTNEAEIIQLVDKLRASLK